MGLIELIRKAKLCLSESNIVAFKARIKPQVKKIFGAGATVTIPIFLRLLNHCGEWVCNKVFHNENPQRRIQDIKESGFTLVTKFESGRKTYHMLLPFDPIKSFTYEQIPAPIRRRIFAVHKGIFYGGNCVNVVPTRPQVFRNPLGQGYSRIKRKPNGKGYVGKVPDSP